MSITPVSEAPPQPMRVRHQAREAVVLMVFSAAMSVAIAGAFVVLAHWGR